jgi:hypothetical protein
VIHQVQTRKNDRNGVSSCTPQFRTPSRQEPRAPTCPRSQAQSRAATPVLTDGQPIASIPNCAPAPMRRPMSAPGRRERAAALTYPRWRSTGKAGASSLGGEATGIKDALQRPVAPQQVGSALRPDSCSPWQLVGRVAAKRNEVRDLLWIHAVALTDLFGPDAGHFAGPYRVEDLCAVRGKLERIPDRRSRSGRRHLSVPRPQLGSARKSSASAES